MRISNQKLAIILACAAMGMFGFGYALVPIYTVMCKTFGINGKPNYVTQAMTILWIILVP